MTISEQVSLAPYTSLRVGGPARFYAVVENDHDLGEAISFARAHQVPLRVLGLGTNLLVPDRGIDALVVRLAPTGMHVYAESEETFCLETGAGTRWDDLVDEATRRLGWGIENLAGIPGSVGGAVVQNIGAYGAELRTVFDYAEVWSRSAGEHRRLTATDMRFGYRRSLLADEKEWIVVRVGIVCKRQGSPMLSYPDLAQARDAGASLSTPREVADTVRSVRSRKFPPRGEGTAGSFFKNPRIGADEFERLRARYPDLPGFIQPDDTVKVSLAWLLDHVLHLNGTSHGLVQVFERQPLVLVALEGATADDVNACATYIAERVSRELGIHIEREVESFVAC